MKLIIAAIALFLAGCASSVKLEDSFKPRGTSIPYTAAFVEGDRVVTTYTRYQFIPDTAALEADCRVAHQAFAEQQKLQISNTTVAFGRNGLLGLSSCTATSKIAK